MEHESIRLAMSNLIVALIVIGVCIPLVRDAVKMNRYYGIRIAKAFESEENWYKINRYGAWWMIACSLVLLLVGVVTFFVPVGSNAGLKVACLLAPLILLVPIIPIMVYAKKI